MEEWDGEALHQIVLETAQAMDLKLGKVAQPLRVAISGQAATPAIDVTLSLLGRSKTLARIQRAIDFIAT
jgi:glutamyl-tRNA synthetase